jgi:hypothetical protein
MRTHVPGETPAGFARGDSKLGTSAGGTGLLRFT